MATKKILFKLVSTFIIFALLFSLFGFINTSVAQEGFSDVPTNHWAYEAIMSLVKKGILSGYPDGTFRPDDPLKRSDTAVILSKVFGLDLSNPDKPSYSDIAEDSWVYGYAETIEKTKLMTESINDRRFRPNDSLLRIEFVPIAVRALGMKYFADSLNEESKSKTLMDFSDASQVPIWARGYLTIAIKSTIVSGYPDGTFRPRNAIKRSEIAVLLFNMLEPIKPNEIGKWETLITPISGAPFKAFLSRKLEGSLVKFEGRAYPNGKVVVNLNDIPFKPVVCNPNDSYIVNIPLGFLLTGEINMTAQYYKKDATKVSNNFRFYSAVPLDLFPNYFRMYGIKYNPINREVNFVSRSATPMIIQMYNSSTGERKTLEVTSEFVYEITSFLKGGDNNVNLTITKPGQSWRVIYGMILTVN